MPRTYNKTGKYSIHQEELVCQICGQTCKNIRSLEVHLRKTHNFAHDTQKYEEYYNNYLKQPEDGICIVCGNPTKQHKFKYDKCCCKSCAAKYSQSQWKIYKVSSKYLDYDNYFKKQIAEGLHIDISIDEAALEFENFKSKPGDIHAQPNKNKIVLYFQQDNFYKLEKEIFSNDSDKRHKLIENREKYLFKSYTEITDYELLRGFKISSIGGNGYSHFSPLWTKYFAEKYNLKYVADPFGGWGHHMIGFAAAGCNYIYNDLSHKTVEGVKKINDFLGKHYQIVEGDAREFIIPYSCDGIFMCPPYYNLEHYECGDFKSIEGYNQLILDVFENCKASKARIIGIIIREDFEYLLEQGFGDWISKEEVNTMKSHFNKAGKKKEFLYCFDN